MISSIQQSNHAAAGSRDRTAEFSAVVKSLWSRQSSAAYIDRQRATQKNDFMLIAKKISKDIASTWAKVEKLSLLARRKSDSSHVNDGGSCVINQDVQKLISFIKHDLATFNSHIARLQQVLKTEASNCGKHKLAHFNSIVGSLQSKLVAISTEFKMLVEHCNTEMLSAMPQQNSPPTQSQQSLYNGNTNRFEQDRSTSQAIPASGSYSSSAVVVHIDEPGGVGGGHLRQRPQQQQQQQQQQQLYMQKALVDDRSDSMNAIQQTIVELGGIFSQMASMVKEQEEMVQRIDSHTDEMYMNVDVAHSEIVKYFKSVSSNRKFMLKIFFVLIILFTVFVLVLR